MPDKDMPPTLSSAWNAPASGYGGQFYADMILSLRAFLNTVAATKPDKQTIEALTGDLRKWIDSLSAFAIDEKHQVYTRRPDLVGCGQVTSPAVTFTKVGKSSLEGVVTLGRYFHGLNGAAHGGVIMFMFDEVAGRMAHLNGRSLARTAYLRTNFRVVTPIESELTIKGWYEVEEDRKRHLRLELRHGETLCAEAEALMVALRPGQP